MKIFRVENKEREGMYAVAIRHILCEMEDGDAWQDGNHRAPACDPKLHWTEDPNYHFGFGSLEQLQAWLPSQTLRNEMALEGHLHISIYETEDGHVGETQAIFRLSSATLAGQLHLATLEELP